MALLRLTGEALSREIERIRQLETTSRRRASYVRLVRPGLHRIVVREDPSELAVLCSDQPVRRRPMAGGASNLTGRPMFTSGTTRMPFHRPLSTPRRPIWW